MSSACPDAKRIREENPDWTNFLFFLNDGTKLVSTIDISNPAILGYIELFKDFDNTIRAGLTFNGIHYHVHRFYEDIIYGRADPGTQRQDGFCLCRFQRQSGKLPLVVLITYDLPNVSARIIPLMTKYVNSVKDSFP